MKELTRRQREVLDFMRSFSERHGVPPAVREIGERFGISRERVRQIETRLKRRLKEFIEAEAPDVDDAGPS